MLPVSPLAYTQGTQLWELACRARCLLANLVETVLNLPLVASLVLLLLVTRLKHRPAWVTLSAFQSYLHSLSLSVILVLVAYKLRPQGITSHFHMESGE